MPKSSYKRIGYHRLTDDSVTSFTVPASAIQYHRERLIENWDIDHVWTRDENGNVDWDYDKGEMK